LLNIGYDKGQFVLEGYKVPDNGDEFSREELAEVYVIASNNDLEEDEPVAASRVKAWLNQETTADGKAFYSEWREGISSLGSQTVKLTPSEFQAFT